MMQKNKNYKGSKFSYMEKVQFSLQIGTKLFVNKIKTNSKNTKGKSSPMYYYYYHNKT